MPLLIALALSGCAAMERQAARDTERLLASAGFQPTPIDRPDFSGLRPRVLLARHQDGRTLYVYADPGGCRCVYVGGPQEYASYRELAVSEAIAADMSLASPNGPAWAAWDPVWAPTDAWADPR